MHWTRHANHADLCGPASPRVCWACAAANPTEARLAIELEAPAMAAIGLPSLAPFARRSPMDPSNPQSAPDGFCAGQGNARRLYPSIGLGWLPGRALAKPSNALLAIRVANTLAGSPAHYLFRSVHLWRSQPQRRTTATTTTMTKTRSRPVVQFCVCRELSG